MTGPDSPPPPPGPGFVAPDRFDWFGTWSHQPDPVDPPPPPPGPHVPSATNPVVDPFPGDSGTDQPKELVAA